MLVPHNLVRRLIVLGAVALFMLLLSGSQAEAGGRALRAWTRLMFGIDRVCKDGIRIGIADSLEDNDVQKEYKLVFVPKGSGEPNENSTIYGMRSGVQLDEISNGKFSSPYCNPVPENGIFEINYCDGPIAVYWSNQLPVGTEQDPPEMDFYVYERDAGTNDDYEFREALKNLPSKGFDKLIVSDCRVDDAAIEIVQTAPGSVATTVTEALVLQAQAYDPDVGTADGDFISRVQFKLLNANGVNVFESIDTSAPYCAFEGEDTCPPWLFYDRGYRWPSGQPIQSGLLTLQATAHRWYGGSTTITKEVNLQLPADARPVNIPLSTQSISAGFNHTCALNLAGGIRCWGDNSQGQLGNGTRSDNHLPVHVRMLRTSGVTAISPGSLHTCAVTAAGGVKCWGDNSYGQLGTGDKQDSTIPQDVLGLASGAAAVSAGDSHTCVLTTAGGVKCWGLNSSGQLGDGSNTSRTTPVDVTGLSSGVVAIAAGGDHTCALINTGGLKCWGLNSSGQLGDGSNTSRTMPVDVTGLSGGVIAFAAGDNSTCAVTTAGAARCWGENKDGQLGNGSNEPSNVPVDVQGLAGGVVTISAGGTHTCAVLNTGSVKCWGFNSSGELGNGGKTASNIPVDVQGLTSRVQAVATGGRHTCVLTDQTDQETIKCWGNGMDGQLGIGNVVRSSTPTGVLGLTSGAAAVSASYRHTCALTDAGGVKCWGANEDGQLGDGSNTDSNVPVNVSGLSSGVVAIAGGAWHTCALTSTGGVKCWGQNEAGQLGDGSNTDSNVPVNVSGLSSGVVAIAGGAWHTCALTAAGAVKCWGSNSNGRLGNGSDEGSKVPVDVVGLSSAIVSVSAGSYHTCAVDNKGVVWCWGNNSYGQLGYDGDKDRKTPVKVTALLDDPAATIGDSIAVRSGNNYNCALSSAGGIRCWGEGVNGELGNGTFAQRSGPVSVLSLLDSVAALSAGSAHACALSGAGVIQCWGSNSFGQLANEGSAHSYQAVAGQGLPGAASMVDAGGAHTCAVIAGGVACWGSNEVGQLGNGVSGSYNGLPLDVRYNNNYPTATADAFVVQAGSAGNVLDVLSNDTTGSEPGEALIIVAVGGTDQGGSVSVAGSALSYTPVAGFVGDEHFLYTIDDGKGATDTGEVTVSVVEMLSTNWIFLPSVQR